MRAFLLKLNVNGGKRKKYSVNLTHITTDCHLLSIEVLIRDILTWKLEMSRNKCAESFIPLYSSE
jgi:hypothetical protein